MSQSGHPAPNDDVVVDIDVDGVQLVTLSRPDVLNALRPETYQQLHSAWKLARDNPEVKSVVITGAGRGFCAGMDLNAPLDQSLSRSDRLRTLYHPHVEMLMNIGKPVIAAINGAAVGAGLALAAAADVRIASENASFVPGFRNIGLAPDNGASWFLPRILGYPTAATWLTSGDKWRPERALETGLIDEVTSPETLVGKAKSIAIDMGNAPGQSSSLTIELLRKASWGKNYRDSLKQQLDLEAETIEIAAVAPGRAEALSQMRARLQR